MKAASLSGLFLVLTLVSSSPLVAHHGYASYDMTKTITLTGTVTDFMLANPHSSLFFDVNAGNSGVEHWSMEFGYIRILKDAGWTKDTLKAGEHITVVFHPAKNGAHVGALAKLMDGDGREIPLSPPPSKDSGSGSQ